MFIRFVSGEIDEDSLVSTGIFLAAGDLLYDPLLPDDEYYPLRELMDWFNEHLKGPYDYRLRTPRRARRAICWFKPTAREHLSRAWQMAWILERNDVFIRTIKVERTGYVLYEDDAQILAEPFADIRRLL
ncbi:MAG TPA: hypothetical protein VJP89_02785 [Pyrinomonadaceae bacterium]|nr:hypothetical protein [Pyrinomonadaceae bacterium]